MAKGKSGRSASSNDDATTLVLRPPGPHLAINPYQLQFTAALPTLPDGREWSPEAFQTARTLAGQPAPVKLRSPQGYSLSDVQSITKTRLGFTKPEAVPICVRRKSRRQVLFAKRLRAKGSGSRRRRHGPYSNHRC